MTRTILNAVPIRTVITLLLVMIPVTVLAAEPLTLQQLQDQARTRRHLIQKFQTRALLEQQNVKIAGSAWRPRLDTGYSMQQLDEATLQETRESSRFQMGLSYNIYAGGRDHYTRKAAELQTEAAVLTLQAAIADLRLQVALRYLDCFESYQRRRIATEEERLLQRRYEDAHNRFQVGLIRRNDLLKIQVELDYAQQTRRSAEADYANRLDWLARETDQELNADALTFKDLERLPQLSPVNSYEYQMLSRRSDIKSLEQTIQALAQQEKVVAAGALPQVDLALIHARYGDNFALGADSHNAHDTRLQLNLSLNLYDGDRIRHTRTRARLAEQAATHELAELRQELITSLQQILRDYDVACTNLEVAEAAIEQARENLRVTDAAYREGLETATDVLDAVFLLSRAEYSYTSARSNVFREYYRLLRMLEQDSL